MEIFGVRLVGLSEANGRKLLATLALVAVVVLLRLALNFTRTTIMGDHGVREMKDEMSREILDGFEAAGIGIASATFDIVGLPTLKVELPKADAGHEQGG